MLRFRIRVLKQHKNMKTLFLLTLLLTSFASVSAEQNSYSVLRDLIGDSINYLNNTEIQYCPDNTCEIFRSMEKTTTKENISDYAYLYLLHKSTYIYLSNSLHGKSAFHITGKEFGDTLINNLASYCPTSQITPDCILSGMAQKLKITTHFGRYDEGNYFEQTTD